MNILCYIIYNKLTYVLGELQNRKEFYKQLSSTKQANTGTATGLPGDCPIYAPDESILLKVGYANSSTSKV